MKSNISRFGLIIAAVVCCWACKKDLSEVHRNTDLNQKLEAMKSPDAQRLVFNAMTNEERLAVWQSHLSWAKASLTLTPIQLAKINELDDLLTADFFSSPGNSDELEIWKASASEIFKPNQMYLLFHQPFDFEQVDFNNSALPIGSLNAPKDAKDSVKKYKYSQCDCASKHNLRSYSLDDCYFYRKSALELGINNIFDTVRCLAGFCRPSMPKDHTLNIGCGFMMKEKCDGNCAFGVIRFDFPTGTPGKFRKDSSLLLFDPYIP